MLEEATLKPMDAGELTLVAMAEEVCFEDFWTRPMIEESWNNGMDLWLVLYEEDRFAGYLALRFIGEEGELLRIGVLPDLRGRGLGKKLMDGVAETSKGRGVRSLLLEVRESNLAARNLYKSYGFVEGAIRKAYYHNPEEDGVIMWCRDV